MTGVWKVRLSGTSQGPVLPRTAFALSLLCRGSRVRFSRLSVKASYCSKSVTFRLIIPIIKAKLFHDGIIPLVLNECHSASFQG